MTYRWGGGGWQPRPPLSDPPSLPHQETAPQEKKRNLSKGPEMGFSAHRSFQAPGQSIVSYVCRLRAHRQRLWGNRQRLWGNRQRLWGNRQRLCAPLKGHLVWALEAQGHGGHGNTWARVQRRRAQVLGGCHNCSVCGPVGTSGCTGCFAGAEGHCPHCWSAAGGRREQDGRPAAAGCCYGPGEPCRGRGHRRQRSPDREVRRVPFTPEDYVHPNGWLSPKKLHVFCGSPHVRPTFIGSSSILTFCGSERVLVVSTEPPDDYSGGRPSQRRGCCPCR